MAARVTRGCTARPAAPPGSSRRRGRAPPPAVEANHPPPRPTPPGAPGTGADLDDTALRALVIENVTAGGDEQALFHLLNLVREARITILLTASKSPGDLGIALPDLNSRLKALPLASILPPDDALLRAVLVKLFADRQLSVEPAVIDYVLLRMERSLAAARAVVAEIDRLALSLQRSVTRQVANAALKSLGFFASTED